MAAKPAKQPDEPGSPTGRPLRGTMKCPTCKSARLEPRDIARGLSANSCPKCSGTFVALENYLTWQKSQPESSKPPDVRLPHASHPTESTGPRLCPACGRFMTRFRIALDLPFGIERCGGCAGFWVERGEWEACQARGIHTRLNSFFTDSWQHRLRQEETKLQQEDRCRTLLGQEAYERVKAFKAWVEQHEKKSVILAYLDSKDVPEPPSGR